VASRASWSGGPVESGTVHVLHDEIGHALLDESVVEHHHVLVRGAAQRHGLLDDLPRRHGPVGVQGKLRGHGSETPAAEDLKRLRRAPEAPRPQGLEQTVLPARQRLSGQRPPHPAVPLRPAGRTGLIPIGHRPPTPRTAERFFHGPHPSPTDRLSSVTKISGKGKERHYQQRKTTPETGVVFTTLRMTSYFHCRNLPNLRVRLLRPIKLPEGPDVLFDSRSPDMEVSQKSRSNPERSPSSEVLPGFPATPNEYAG